MRVMNAIRLDAPDVIQQMAERLSDEVVPYARGGCFRPRNRERLSDTWIAAAIRRLVTCLDATGREVECPLGIVMTVRSELFFTGGAYFYDHGDPMIGDSQLFYCALCDVFWDAEHFRTAAHSPEEHRAMSARWPSRTQRRAPGSDNNILRGGVPKVG